MTYLPSCLTRFSPVQRHIGPLPNESEDLVRPTSFDRTEENIMPNQQKQDPSAVSPSEHLGQQRPSVDRSGIAAMDAGPDHFARPQSPTSDDIKPFEFAVRDAITAAPIATGSIFAAGVSQVPADVADLLSQVQKILAKRLDYRNPPSIGAAHVDVQRKSIPFLNPPKFSVRDDDRMVFAVELIVGGKNFFPSDIEERKGPSQPSADRSDKDIVRPLLDQIISTDPWVRRAQAAGKAPSRLLAAYHANDDDGSLQVALHVTSGEEVIPVSSATAKATLLLLLDTLDFSNFGGGSTWEGQAETTSASVRDHQPDDKLEADPPGAAGIAEALAHLNTLGLHELERSIFDQAVSTISGVR